MELISNRRNEGFVPGQVLRDRVLIPGWEQPCRWGWDGEAGNLYAYLWQNIDPAKADARYQIDSRTRRLSHPGHLVLALLESTSLPALAIVYGLGLGSAQVLRDRPRAVTCRRNRGAHQRAATEWPGVRSEFWGSRRDVSEPVCRGFWGLHRQRRSFTLNTYTRKGT